MHVTDLARRHVDGMEAITARVLWEDRDRPAQDVYFATADFGDELTESANPFLLGCVLCALEHSERRIRVDGPTCPWLRENVRTVVAYYDRWFHGGRRGLEIETAGDVEPEGGRRIGTFLSGGVDSLFTVYENRDSVPEGHPGRIRDALVMRGFDVLGDEPGAERTWDRALSTVAPLAERLDLALVPIVTNLRQLEPDPWFWGEQFQGTILSATAHALAPRLSDVIIAASQDIAHLSPYGSHPAVDPNLSSFSLRVHHRGERYTRLQKLRRLVAAGDALTDLRVCSKGPADGLNCQRCEKCVRTMLELLVVGALADCRSFDATDVTTDMVGSVSMFIDAATVAFYGELVGELRRIGRNDLARAIVRAMVRDVPRRLLAHVEDAMKDLDHAFFGDVVRARVRRWRGARGGL